MVAIYRMEFERISNAEALAGLPSFGRELSDFPPDFQETIANYVPRWKKSAGPSSRQLRVGGTRERP